MERCVVKKASNMSEATCKVLEEKIKERFGKDIAVTFVTDDSIIGGFVLDLNGHVFDLSIQTQLERLKQHMNS